MKKLHFLICALIAITPFTAYTRLIEIITEDGTAVNVSCSETVEGFFEKCRKDNRCTAPYKNLFLDFDGKLIREGSPEANRTLWYHSSLGSNKATVATLQYPQPRSSSNYLNWLLRAYDEQPNALIDVEAPNGRIKRCSPNDTPAYFFRKCRNCGDCKDAAPMTLNFGNFEIKEGSRAANRSFGSFNTDSGFAQVKKR